MVLIKRNPLDWKWLEDADKKRKKRESIENLKSGEAFLPETSPEYKRIVMEELSKYDLDKLSPELHKKVLKRARSKAYYFTNLEKCRTRKRNFFRNNSKRIQNKIKEKYKNDESYRTKRLAWNRKSNHKHSERLKKCEKEQKKNCKKNARK